MAKMQKMITSMKEDEPIFVGFKKAETVVKKEHVKMELKAEKTEEVEIVADDLPQERNQSYIDLSYSP